MARGRTRGDREEVGGRRGRRLATPEEEFERWKGGARPGRKRRCECQPGTLVVLAVPVWWRTTAIVRAPISRAPSQPRRPAAQPSNLPSCTSPTLGRVVGARERGVEGSGSALGRGPAGPGAPGVEATRLAELARFDLDADEWQTLSLAATTPRGLPPRVPPAAPDDTQLAAMTRWHDAGRARGGPGAARSGADDEETLDAATRATRHAAEFRAGNAGGESEPGDPNRDFSPLTPDGRALLSFTLANASPDRERGHVYSWRLAPTSRTVSDTSAALSQLGGLRPKVSPVPRQARGTTAMDDDKKAFYLSSELPFFVDSEEPRHIHR